jgi:ABC-2 type transport system permease protein
MPVKIDTKAYPLTLLQKLLGKQYKWWYIILYNFKTAIIDTTSLIITVIRFTIPLLISLLIYSSFSETKNLSGELALTNYIFQFSLIAWGTSWDLRFNIIKGGLSNALLVPTDYIFRQFFVAIGFNSFVFFLRSLVLIPILYFTSSPVILSGNILFVLILMVISFISFIYLEIIIGSTAFWLNIASNRIIEIFYDLVPLLSGALVLLSLNPITNIFKYNPFALVAYHPIQIYLGKYYTNEIIFVFAGGLIWGIILYFLSKFIFKLGLKRNEAVGL